MTDNPGLWRRKKWLRICVRVLVALIVLAGGVKLWFWNALRSELAQLRAAGEPTTWAEVLAMIEPIPDDENSALVLAPALESFEEWDRLPAGEIISTRWGTRFGVRPSDDLSELMRACMIESGTALGVLHEAAKRPHGRWPAMTDPDVGVHRYPPYLTGVRSAAGLLSIESELHAVAGEGRQAAQAIFACRRLTASMGSQPPGVSGERVRRACREAACDATERALSLGELPAKDLVMLRREFATEAEQMNLRMESRAQRVDNLWVTQNARGSVLCKCSCYPLIERLDTFVALLPGVVERDALRGLRYMAEWMRLLDLSPRKQFIEAEALAERTYAELERCRSVSTTVVTRVVYDRLWAMFLMHMSDKQRQHVVRAALAVEQFRMERGDWPETLADLVPDYLEAVPQDWFAPEGTTIGYARTPAGARLWTWGRIGTSVPGLTNYEGNAYMRLVHAIESFKKRKGRLPESLSELEDRMDGPLPLSPFTGEPYSYVTNAANPELFILGGFTKGKTESEFWKQTMTTEEWVREHSQTWGRIIFRLLNPKLRGATQARFADEICGASAVDSLYKVGYTADRMKELGFSAGEVEEFEVRRDEIREKEERERENGEQNVSRGEQ